ncbi:MAG: hypothetical protein ACRDCE_17330 [Cetobacterium sp.]|uniref:hypothetical protein n=1 Tax=Cetobacterium sp. TaxID=2071632 RepID=UPI003EE5680C
MKFFETSKEVPMLRRVKIGDCYRHSGDDFVVYYVSSDCKSAIAVSADERIVHRIVVDIDGVLVIHAFSKSFGVGNTYYKFVTEFKLTAYDGHIAFRGTETKKRPVEVGDVLKLNGTTSNIQHTIVAIGKDGCIFTECDGRSHMMDPNYHQDTFVDTTVYERGK